eukprot:4264977-Pyramimonas_sp.AAC.1
MRMKRRRGDADADARGWSIRREAAKYFANCMLLGPPWVCFDPMTEALRCLYLTRARRSVACPLDRGSMR